MTPIILLTVGGYLVFLAATDQLREVISGIASQPAPQNFPDLYRYIIGAAVVSIPVVVLEKDGNNRGAWQYVTLIVISLLVFYYRNVAKTAEGINSILRS